MRVFSKYVIHLREQFGLINVYLWFLRIFLHHDYGEFDVVLCLHVGQGVDRVDVVGLNLLDLDRVNRNHALLKLVQRDSRLRVVLLPGGRSVIPSEGIRAGTGRRLQGEP